MMICTMIRLEDAADRDCDLVDLLFADPETRRCAWAFLDRLKQSGGRLTKKDTSAFAFQLASGELGCKIARSNFCSSILHNFLSLKLLALEKEMEPSGRGTR
jgi:hypothetical protein